ncbi:cryptochrome/photolyase family protein [Pseudoxanthomonas daejeonensis]|uniref:Deoxyribodipyrimidine photolyase n=1 Tax=Pseudoxanthomonas daejeonensis TaxID=266062 RepID=A0ABQ6ZBH8_9GAMM|nr:deoxyribodipyrimidine photo-lyase [Pseudoxanthomonas daejeonensis]KAF1697445.1 deoxyribodipyrimidine photolyase [Pseudoxanthomonas daejeonensis]
MGAALVWFRDDLRLDDQPALRAALERGWLPIPVYIHAPDEEGGWAPGAASDAWRRRSLAALSAELERRGSRLLVLHGPSLGTLQALAALTGAEAVLWTRRYEPAIEQRDARIKRSLRQAGLHAESFNGSLLFEPWELATKQGDPYRVFTPFWRSARAQWRVPETWDAPAQLPSPDAIEAPHDVSMDHALPAPVPAWDTGFWKRFNAGEAGAREALARFLGASLDGYAAARDMAAEAGTSRLSPHLHFGEISVQRVAASIIDAGDGVAPADRDRFLAELGWREFAHHVMHHFPHVPERDLDPRFEDFRWARPLQARLDAWRHGRTGVPIVDAGMRELWHTGWMHNRVRMIVASWLTKHLRVHWQHGARWFWDTLVDADLANNTQGWQWTAGTGADAAPYFRVFNPVTQARKFDPDGAYVARWVPELAALPLPARFAPWEQPDLLRRHAPGYPRMPQVDLAEGRQAALEAFAALKRTR